MTLTQGMMIGTMILFAGGVAARGPAPQRPPASTSAPVLQRPATSVKAVGTVRDIMLGIVFPTSTLVFETGGEPPKTPEQWTALENAALTLAESANLLLIGGREKDQAAWTTWAIQLREQSEGFLRATRAKNTEAMATANDEVYVTCEGCHKVYVPGSVN